VVDAGGAFGDWNLALAQQADELLLVTTNDVAALHATQRALAYLEAHDIAASRVRLLVSRYRHDAGLPRQAIETATGSEVFHMLPSDHEAIQKSLLEGKPALPGSKYAKGVAQLSEKLAGQNPSGKKPLLGGLFRGR